MNRFLYLIGPGVIGLGVLALPVCATESIELRTGFHIAADRHEMDGATIRIFSGDGVTEMAANLVTSIETVESPAPAAGEQIAQPVAPMVAPEAPVEAPKPVAATPVELAASAALKYSLPSAFVAGVMRAESGFNAAAVSPKGAIGLMQLMPDTAHQLGVNPRLPAENTDGGARYLRDLLALYEDKPDQVVLALAAYNAGPAAVEKYHGVPPFRETHDYILRVLKAWNPPPAPK